MKEIYIKKYEGVITEKDGYKKIGDTNIEELIHYSLNDSKIRITIEVIEEAIKEK